MGIKVITSKGYPNDVTSAVYMDKTLFYKAHLRITIKDGVLGKAIKYFKGEFSKVEVVHEEEESSDTGQRIKNAAIGVVLLGPLGLLGAALGGNKKLIKVRFESLDGKQLLLEMKPKECETIFKDLMDIDLQKMLNEQYLK